MLWWVIGATFPVLWLWAFYREDRYEREPPWMLMVAFAFGCLAVFPARLLEDFFLRQGLDPQDTLWARAAGLFLVAGPVEELCKFAPIRLYIYRRVEFNEPMDGILYSVAAAIGFATVENYLYMIDPVGGPQVILARAPGATLAHILFAGFWGSALGWTKFMKDRRAARVMVLTGLFWAMLTHGAFDFITFSAGQETPAWVARGLLLLLMTGSYVALRHQITRCTELSPFRPQ